MKQKVKVLRSKDIDTIERQLDKLVEAYNEIVHLSCMYIAQEEKYVALVVYHKNEPLL